LGRVLLLILVEPNFWNPSVMLLVVACRMGFCTLSS